MFAGWYEEIISHLRTEVKNWIYFYDVLIELCPSISWIYRISTSASNKELANVWRNIWGVICCSIEAREVYLISVLRTVWSDKWEPDGYLVVRLPVLLLFLLLTGSHNLLNYAIICLVDKQTKEEISRQNAPKHGISRLFVIGEIYD